MDATPVMEASVSGAPDVGYDGPRGAQDWVDSRGAFSVSDIEFSFSNPYEEACIGLCDALLDGTITPEQAGQLVADLIEYQSNPDVPDSCASIGMETPEIVDKVIQDVATGMGMSPDPAFSAADFMIDMNDGTWHGASDIEALSVPGGEAIELGEKTVAEGVNWDGISQPDDMQTLANVMKAGEGAEKAVPDIEPVVIDEINSALESLNNGPQQEIEARHQDDEMPQEVGEHRDDVGAGDSTPIDQATQLAMETQNEDAQSLDSFVNEHDVQNPEGSVETPTQFDTDDVKVSDVEAGGLPQQDLEDSIRAATDNEQLAEQYQNQVEMPQNDDTNDNKQDSEDDYDDFEAGGGAD